MHYQKEIYCSFCKAIFVRTNIGKKWCCEMCRFLAKIEKTDSCWIWKKGKTVDGYGMHSFSGKTIAAHRASWIIFNGEIPETLIICHKCDNPICVNPEHLFIGTQKDNHSDRKVKGRNADKRGEKHHLHKLTNEDVINIRKLLETKTQTEIAKIYNVDQSCICNIKRRRNWNHL